MRLLNEPDLAMHMQSCPTSVQAENLFKDQSKDKADLRTT